MNGIIVAVIVILCASWDIQGETISSSSSDSGQTGPDTITTSNSTGYTTNETSATWATTTTITNTTEVTDSDDVSTTYSANSTDILTLQNNNNTVISSNEEELVETAGNSTAFSYYFLTEDIANVTNVTDTLTTLVSSSTNSTNATSALGAQNFQNATALYNFNVTTTTDDATNIFTLDKINSTNTTFVLDKMKTHNLTETAESLILEITDLVNSINLINSSIIFDVIDNFSSLTSNSTNYKKSGSLLDVLSENILDSKEKYVSTDNYNLTSLSNSTIDLYSKYLSDYQNVTHITNSTNANHTSLFDQSNVFNLTSESVSDSIENSTNSSNFTATNSTNSMTSNQNLILNNASTLRNASISPMYNLTCAENRTSDINQTTFINLSNITNIYISVDLNVTLITHDAHTNSSSFANGTVNITNMANSLDGFINTFSKEYQFSDNSSSCIETERLANFTETADTRDFNSTNSQNFIENNNVERLRYLSIFTNSSNVNTTQLMNSTFAFNSTIFQKSFNIIVDHVNNTASIRNLFDRVVHSISNTTNITSNIFDSTSSNDSSLAFNFTISTDSESIMDYKDYFNVTKYETTILRSGENTSSSSNQSLSHITSSYIRVNKNSTDITDSSDLEGINLNLANSTNISSKTKTGNCSDSDSFVISYSTSRDEDNFKSDTTVSSNLTLITDISRSLTVEDIVTTYSNDTTAFTNKTYLIENIVSSTITNKTDSTNTTIMVGQNNNKTVLFLITTNTSIIIINNVTNITEVSTITNVTTNTSVTLDVVTMNITNVKTTTLVTNSTILTITVDGDSTTNITTFLNTTELIKETITDNTVNITTTTVTNNSTYKIVTTNVTDVVNVTTIIESYNTTSSLTPTDNSTELDSICTYEGFFADPNSSNCTGYIECIKNDDGTYIEASYVCPDNFLYNPNTTLCDDEYVCPTTDTESEDNTDDIFSCTSAGRFANSSDSTCQTYYFCELLSDGSYAQYEYTCPSTSVFDPINKYCTTSFTCST